MWMKVRRGGLSALVLLTGASLLQTSTLLATSAQAAGRTLNLRVSASPGDDAVVAWILHGSNDGAFRAAHSIAAEGHAPGHARLASGAVVPVRLVVGTAAAVRVVTNAATVADLLAALAVKVRPLDVTIPPRTSELRAADVVRVIRVRQSRVTQVEPVPFETLIRYSKEFPQGSVHVLEPGAPGSARVTYVLTRRNGVEVSRLVMDRVVLTEPVARVERRGAAGMAALPGGIQFGQASWYDWPGCAGMRAAHRSLPYGTAVTVTNLDNGKWVAVTINDRGPFIAGRVIDLCPSAFAAIAPLGQGVVRVRISW